MTNEEHTNDAQGANAAEAKVEKMFEYGYRKSNYGPDELVTDAHGNPISVIDAMLSAEDAAKGRNFHAPPVLLLPPEFQATPVRQSACAR